jgi:hypothetical protein
VRIRIAVALILALAPAALLHAQFQAPTKEELEMTSDPKAPGAAAVYLNIEETNDDPHHFESLYARIKVLQEKGKELATVEIPYLEGNSKVTDIEARTIHPDGTVIPLTGTPDDLLIYKNKDTKVGGKVFNLPSVEVGSILEYRFTIDYPLYAYSSPHWEIQRPYFVHSAHFSFTPFSEFQKAGFGSPSQMNLANAHGIVNSLVWWSILPPGAHLITEVTGRYKLDVADIPPSPDEEWMPPIQSLLYKVDFFYCISPDLQNFWVTEAKRWSKEVDHFAEPTKPIQDAVRNLIAPGDSELEKARKLYKAVQALDNTDFSRAKGLSERKQLKLKQINRAEDTWAQKSGSSEDIALLYLAMLRAAGLTAYDMKVVNRERGIFDPGYLNFDQLDDNVIILNTGGQEILLDPGERMCPFETVAWTHSGASGVRQSPDGHYSSTTPFQAYKPNSVLRAGDVTVDKSGSVTGTFRFVMTGQEALRWRQAVLRKDEDEVRKQFTHWLESMMPEGVQASLDHFLALDQPDENLMAIVNVQGSLGTATARRLILPGFFFESRGHQPFIDEETRLEPVDMHYGEQIIDQVTYHLPAGMTVEGAPKDAQVTWPSEAVLITRTVTAPGTVTVGRTFAHVFTVVGQKELPGSSRLLSKNRVVRRSATGACFTSVGTRQLGRFHQLSQAIWFIYEGINSELLSPNPINSGAGSERKIGVESSHLSSLR